MKTDFKKKIGSVLKLSIPAMLTQIANILMSYIDSGMVGRLGEDASASIGVVSTTIWLFDGLLYALAMGFGVMIAHSYGAKNYKRGRIILKTGLIVCIGFSFIMLGIGVGIHKLLPIMLKAPEAIRADASWYFLIFSLNVPFLILNNYCASSLQCSGNMVIPSILNVMICLLDVVFNMIFIPHLGVIGAALGTALATIVTSITMFILCCFRKNEFNIFIKDNFVFDFRIVKQSVRISFPMMMEQIMRCGAMITSTSIVAPLGSVSIAANSFAVTAESICYMPGFGVASAATTLVGQSIGAEDYKGAKSLGNLAIVLGAVTMTLTAAIMFFLCPFVFNLLTPVEAVRNLSTNVLRVGLFAETLYGVSIVANGALRGAGDTLVPSIMMLSSIWIVRITLSFILVKPFGLLGVWIANTIELNVRGIIFLIRQLTSKYYKKEKSVNLSYS